jgi:hypothetical protein
VADTQVTFSTATLPATTTIVIRQANCSGPLFVLSVPAHALTLLPATVQCVSGRAQAAITLTLLTYAVSAIQIVGDNQVFSYLISVVPPG